MEHLVQGTIAWLASCRARKKKGIDIVKIGTPTNTNSLDIKGDDEAYTLDITTYSGDFRYPLVKLELSPLP
jgi:hypothetical protein